MILDSVNLDNRERALVIDTCYEISLLVDPNLFCGLFDRNYNTFSIIGLSDDDYDELSFMVKDSLACNDDFYMQFSFMYDMFKEISSRVDVKVFLDLFQNEENSLFFLNISDEKFKSLCLSVNDVRDIIIYEDNLEKKLLFTKN